MTADSEQQRVRVVAVRGRFWLSTPMPAAEAVELRNNLAWQIARIGDGPNLVSLATDAGDAWIRAREIQSIEPVPAQAAQEAPLPGAGPGRVSGR